MEKLKVNSPEIQLLPEKTGVYLIKDKNDQIIYIGKAKNIKARLKQHFQKIQGHDGKKALLQSRAKSVDFIICSSQVEALILEDRLIKKHNPPLNFRLRDSKTYPLIEITKHEYPLIRVIRRPSHGSRVLGPYASAKAAYQAVDLMRRLFFLRRCNDSNFLRHKKMGRPCIYYDTKSCSAPCCEKIKKGDYIRGIASARAVLSGRIWAIYQKLSREMDKAAESLDFERAAFLRDGLNSIQIIKDRQRAVGLRGGKNIIGTWTMDDNICISHIAISGGIMAPMENFFATMGDYQFQEIVINFIKESFSGAPPGDIILEKGLLSNDWSVAIQDYLTRKWGNSRIINPVGGELRPLLDMCIENAKEALLRKKQGKAPRAIEELKVALNMARIPQRIELFDISNIAGEFPVGAMSVAQNGAVAKKEYRKWLIKTVAGPDDYASLKEVLMRHRQRIEAGDSPLPDLIVVDGGLGQLNILKKIFENRQFDIALGALAEKEEILYDQRGKNTNLPLNSAPLKLIRMLRDEAHRFALNFHRKKRSNALISSGIEGVPGIGPARRRALLIRFGSFNEIKGATLEELRSVLGPVLGLKVFEYLHK